MRIILSPTIYELDKGNYLDRASFKLRVPDIEVVRSEFLKLNESIARELGLMICPRSIRSWRGENRSLKDENKGLRAEKHASA